MYRFDLKKLINIVFTGVIIGVIVGAILAIQSVWANSYIQYKMFSLIVLSFQKFLNYSVLLIVIGLAGLYVLWAILVERMQIEKNRVINLFKFAVVILIVFTALDWMLREFTDIPLFYGIENIAKLLLRLFKGNLPYAKSMSILKSQYLYFTFFVIGAVICTPLIYVILKKISTANLLNITQKKSFVSIAILTGVLLVLGNLVIVVDRIINEPEGPNVVLIVIDALRPDHLSSYDYDRLSSPNIDKLSNDGIKFNNAISQGNRTSLSMPSMFTGLYTSDQGYHMLQKIESRVAPLCEEFATIAEVFKNEGYTTYAASCQPWISPESGYGQGFDYFEIVSSTGDNLSDKKTVQRALEWLDDNSDKKFFIFLDLMGPHTPYDPPPPFNSLYSSGQKAKSKLISDLNDIYSKKQFGKYYHFLQNASRDNISTEDLSQLIELYDGKISFTDFQIGTLIEKLKNLSIYNNTLIVLTADHGEAFLEHDKFLHGRSVYNEEVHVPLIMTCPDKLPKNKEIDDVVELVNILPTLANICGISVSEIKLRGTTLLPIKDNPYYNDPYAYTEGCGFIKYMTNEWSLICDPEDGECELYNIKNDPWETYNLSSTKPDIVSNLKIKLFALIDEKMYPSFKEVKTVRIPEKKIKELKSLGYLH